MARSSFKNGAYLLITALVCAAASGLAFAYFGEAVFYVLFGISWIALSMDNVRLRREMNRLRGQQAP